jgi:DNA-binding GntR family transcriptional regulator/AcrR family transcriptional regulator
MKSPGKSLAPLPRSTGRRTTLEVYDTLRDAILGGKLKPGTILSQVKLARDLGVSRTPVREALRRLQEGGLVAGEPNLRSRVLGLNPEEIEALYVKRILLESLAVELTTRRMNSVRLSELLKAIESLESKAARTSFARWQALHRRLHSLMVSDAGPFLTQDLEMLESRSEQYQTAYPEEHHSRYLERGEQEHRAIFAAMQSGDAPLAARLVAEHHASTATQMLRVLAPEYVSGRIQASLTFLTRLVSLDIGPAVADGSQIEHAGPPERARLRLVSPSMRSDAGHTGNDAPEGVRAFTAGWIDATLASFSLAASRVDPQYSMSVAPSPQAAAERTAILQAARRVFLRHRGETISMDRLAMEAKVSAGTLYSYFKDWQAVLEAMVLSEPPGVTAASADTAQHTVERSLYDAGVSFLEFVTDPQLRSLQRLVAGIGSHESALGQSFFDAGLGRVMAVLRSLLAQGHASGLLQTPDVDAAANDLVGLWQGSLPAELDFQRHPQREKSELRRRAAHGLRQFLKLYASPERRPELNQWIDELAAPQPVAV